MPLDRDFWNQRYLETDTPWDIGSPSPPLTALLDRIQDRATRILIPGAGTAYEAVYLHQRGFSQVYVCDWAEAAFEHLLENAPDFPRHHLLCGDFFEMTGQYDLMLEQTFFCAIDPSARPRYVEQVHALLVPGGKLAGLLFATPFETPGPPFGGTESEYRALFEARFHIKEMKIAKNSVRPRAGNELYFEMIKLKIDC